MKATEENNLLLTAITEEESAVVCGGFVTVTVTGTPLTVSVPTTADELQSLAQKIYGPSALGVLKYVQYLVTSSPN